MEVNTPPEQTVTLGAPTSSAAQSSSSPVDAGDDDSQFFLHRCMVAMEHSTVKVPYEMLNRKFRTAQKALEREASSVGSCISEMQAALSGSPTPPTNQISSLLQGVITQVRSLKRKTCEAVSGEVESARVVKRRVDHLNEPNDPRRRHVWERKRIDRLITDYLLREGCYDTAKILVKQRNLEDLTNLQIFLNAHEVEISLQKHDTSKCLAWCHENKSKLKKLSSTLEFNLRLQEFIELVKTGRRLDAVWHARKYFVLQDPEQLEPVQRCMALLAFPDDTDVPEYSALLSNSRWDDLVEQFRAENLRLYQLCPHASFIVVLQAGLSALKTPQCYKTNKENYNPDCPVCMPTLNYISSDLPYAHCSQSRLICNITGDLLNENNLPLMLPNGYVYGTKALEASAAKNAGEVTCPRTGTRYLLSEAQKVYVM